MFFNVAASGGSGATTLDDLTDVVVFEPANGELLVFQDGAWVNLPPAGNEVRSDVDTGIAYMGTAPAGTLESDEVWNVTRIDVSVTPVTVTSATGIAWDDRTTAVYS